MKSENKKWVIFDVDDVLLNFVEALYASGKENGMLTTDKHWRDWDSYNHLEYFVHENQDEFRKFLVQKKVIENLKPFPEVAEVLQELQKDYKLGFLTSRGYHPNAVDVTQNSLMKHFGISGKVIIAGTHGMKKTSYLHHFEGEIAAYVDDAIMHVKDFNEFGIKAALRAQAWNKGELKYPIVKDMKEFLKFVKSHS